MHKLILYFVLTVWTFIDSLTAVSSGLFVPKRKEKSNILLIENLNKNSYYGCMPVISVYRININDLKEIKYNPKAEPWDDDYVNADDVFYLDDKTYTFSEKYFSYYELPCIIQG